MRIVCPNCETAYDAPESVIARGRAMRCARCRWEWTPSPAAPPAPAPAPVPAPGAERSVAHGAHGPILPEPELVIHAPIPEMPPPPEGPRAAVVAAWVASLLVLVVATWLAIDFRQPIMRGWPATARIYAMLGYR